MSLLKPLKQEGTATGAPDSSNGDESKILGSALKYLKNLASEYQCPICEGNLVETHRVAGCQHRFCGSCMRQSLGNCIKKCPGCMSSTEFFHVEEDKQFDKIVYGLVKVVEMLEKADKTRQKRGEEKASPCSEPNVTVSTVETQDTKVEADIAMDREKQQPVLIDENTENNFDRMCTKFEPEDGRTSENKRRHSTCGSSEVSNGSDNNGSDNNSSVVVVKQESSRRSLRKRKLPPKLEAYQLTSPTKRKSVRKEVGDGGKPNNNNQRDKELIDISAAPIKEFMIKQEDSGSTDVEIAPRTDLAPLNFHEKEKKDNIQKEWKEFNGRGEGEKEKAGIDKEDCHVRTLVEEEHERGEGGKEKAGIDKDCRVRTLVEEEHERVDTVKEKANIDKYCHVRTSVEEQQATETELDCNVRPSVEEEHERVDTVKEIMNSNLDQNIDEKIDEEQKILRQPRKLVIGYSGKVRQSKLEISTGHSRKVLNEHLDLLGLSAKFSVSVVSKKGNSVSHLTLNEKWNDLPYDRKETLEFWLGGGRHRQRIASPLDPARYRQRDDGIPIFWNSKVHLRGKTRSICYYIGHYKCVLFDMFNKPMIFKGEERAGLLEFQFVKYCQTLGGKLDDIEDEEASILNSSRVDG